MSIDNLFSTALRALWRNKSRSLLTMLGVIIGVLAVILLLAIGSGLQNYITKQFDSLGANTVVVFPGKVFDDKGNFGSRESQVGSLASSKLSFEDERAIKRLREYVREVTAAYTNVADVTYKGKAKKGANVYATDASYAIVRNTKAEKGRFFSDADEAAKRRVVVLGPKIAADLFGEVDPVGKTIIVADVSFEVIGVTEEKGGGFGGPTFDEYIFMPITTAHDLFNTETIMTISVEVVDKDSIYPAIDAIKKVLSRRLREDEFSVFDQKQILNTINSILGIMTAGLGGIAAISLLVGGIGIMNIMLVSVTERTREIGLRKALGATPNVILVQFLIESSLLSIIGGFIGIIISYAITLVMQRFFPAQVTWWSVGLAFVVSAVTGIVFGVLPARRASKLSPIEALRYE